MKSALFLKTLKDQRKSTAWWMFGLLVLCTVQLWVYPTISKSAADLQKFLDLYPDALKKIFRMQDYTSGPGYLSTELFSLMLPIIVISIGCASGARAGAQEEEDGTADILLSLPVSRFSILATKVSANLLILFSVGLLMYGALSIGAPIVDLHISNFNLLSGVVNCTFLGVAFNGLTTVTSALSGRRGLALGVGVGSAVSFYVLFSLAGLVSSFEHVLPINPFQWTIGNAPLFNGMDWLGLLKLIAASAAFLGISAWGFNRRDIRS
ncbi:MAG: ABC transporter permease [Actinomycetales bacterium]|nr:ABC transporter permease [Actinomycetales bacterium]